MKTEDVHLIHRLWLNITREQGLDAVHHHDILTEALTRFARDYAGHDREEIIKGLLRAAGRHTPGHQIQSGESGQKEIAVDQHTQDKKDVPPGC